MCASILRFESFSQYESLIPIILTVPLQGRAELVVERLGERLEGVVVRVQLVDPELRRLDGRERTLGAHEDQLVRVLALQAREHRGEALQDRCHDCRTSVAAPALWCCDGSRDPRTP